MKIETGLFNHMVLQRNAKGVSEAQLTGTTSATGKVIATVTLKARPVKGFTAVRIGAAARGRFTACLRGLPAGGPYSITLDVAAGKVKAAERLEVADVLVGDVWIVAGQSNAEGCGLLQGQPKPDPLVRAFFMNDEWRVAADPIHNMWECVDQVHIDFAGGSHPGKKEGWGAGPGVSFGQEMHKRTGIPQGLLACGHGGTTMGQWSPGLKDQGTRSLYGATLRRVKTNGGRVAGMIWYQGESDADPVLATVYTENMKKFVAALRRDVHAPGLPVAMVQISRVTNWGSEAAWNSIQDQQRRMPGAIPNLTVVPAIDLAFDDGIHLGGAAQVELGRRLGYAMCALREGPRSGQPPIAFNKTRIETRDNRTHVVLEYDHVDGKLVADGRPCGFSILNATRNELVYDIRLDGNKVILRSDVNASDPSGTILHYGRGLNPCCNIRDSAGRSLPVMGPLTLGEFKDEAPFVRLLRVSRLMPGEGKLDNLNYPRSLDGLELGARVFAGDFCDLHSDIGMLAPTDTLLYFACRFECPARMRLAMMLGYDGPVKAWIDGKQLYHDPNGTNPARPDQGRAEFMAEAGRHEALVALGSNSGKAWGIFLRFLRLCKPGDTAALPGEVRILG